MHLIYDRHDRFPYLRIVDCSGRNAVLHGKRYVLIGELIDRIYCVGSGRLDETDLHDTELWFGS